MQMDTGFISCYLEATRGAHFLQFCVGHGLEIKEFIVRVVPCLVAGAAADLHRPRARRRGAVPVRVVAGGVRIAAGEGREGQGEGQEEGQ